MQLQCVFIKNRVFVMGVDSMEVGFIGTGSMGRILIEAFIASGAIPPSQITIINRTKEKAESLVATHPEIKLASSVEELIQKCGAIFICVRPSDYVPVLKLLQQNSHADQTVISITSAILLKDMERSIPSKIIKLIPSITNAALSGASLVMFSERLSIEEKNMWNQIFASMSQPIEIDEQYVRVSSDLISCGPAFFSYLLQSFIESAVSQTGISHESATFMVTEMMIGYGRLISIGGFTLETLQERVLVPGGVTGIGLGVIKEELGPLFDHLFQKTHEKFEQDVEESKEWLKQL